MAELLTTREVAEYLRIKERKVYELVRAGRIPCARITGKLLFPRALIDAWVVQGTEGPAPAPHTPRPAVIAGSHDPLLDWAVRESGSGLALLICGSVAGLEHFAAGDALAAGCHLLDTDSGEYNVAAVRRTLGGADVALIAWAWRNQGLVLAPGNPKGIADIADLASTGARIACREDGSGSRLLFHTLVGRGGIDMAALDFAAEVPKSEIELGLAVLDGRADAGLAVEAVARRLNLAFLPLARERYDLVVDRHAYFEPPMQRLLEFCRTPAFRRHAAALGGYDIEALGRVVWNAP